MVMNNRSQSAIQELHMGQRSWSWARLSLRCPKNFKLRFCRLTHANCAAAYRP